jgi:hypothetical protein
MTTEYLKDKNKLACDELDMQTVITTAKAHPRDIDDFVTLTTKLVLKDKETAQACFYYLPARSGGSEPIEGGSIRLAELAAYVWGNLITGKRLVSNDGEFITAEGFAWDLERNQGTRVQIQRSIINSYGKRYSHEMQATTANAAASIAWRNAIYTIIPKVIVNPIWLKAKEFAVLSSKRKSLIDRFLQWNISSQQILDFFQKKSVRELTQEDLERLIGLGTSIKEGHIAAEEAFVVKEESTIEIIQDEDRVRDLLK